MFFRSFIWRLFKRLFGSLQNAIDTSFFLGAHAFFCDRISRYVKASCAYSWLDSNVLTDKAYETSWFIKKICSVKERLRVLLAGFSACTRRSFCLAFCKKVIRKLPMDVLLAFFLGGMLIMPHDWWHNLYFVVIIFLFAFLLIAVKGFQGVLGNRHGLFLFVFFLTFGLNVVFAVQPWDALRFFLFLLASALLSLCVPAVLKTEEKLMRFLNVILLFVGITGVLGIAQRLTGLSVNPEFVDVETNQNLPGRVFSTFSNPNNFAQILVLFLPFFIPAILYTKKTREKIALVLAMVAAAVSLIMTYSRSAWLGIAFAVVIFVCIYDKRKLLCLAVLAFAVVPFLPRTVISRIVTIGSLEDSSNAYRLHIWRGCFTMLKDVAFTGVGLGPASFQAVYPAYASRAAAFVPHSHMLLLQIVLETGLLGLGTVLAYILGTLKQVAGQMRRMTRKQKCYASAGISAMCGIFVVSFFEYIWFYPRVMFVFWLVPGVFEALLCLTKRD